MKNIVKTLPAILKPLALIGLFVFIGNFSIAQTIPVGTVSLEDYYRRAQLLGEIDASVSFTVRPVNPLQSLGRQHMFYPDSPQKKLGLLNIQHSYFVENTGIKAVLLPVSIQLQSNTHHPSGWNDGAMIPAKGLQSVISAGIYAEWGPVSIQLKPEIVNAVNSDFETFDNDHYPVIFARYYDFYNNIDQPTRFGNKPYHKILWGQSSIRLNYKGFSAGLSSENIWWGPGMRNSLLMSNNAPGFNHLTLNTAKPIKTAIGSFEGQLIAGRLEGSGFGVLEPEKDYIDGPVYLPKPADWRLLSGMVLTWNPKWVPGLFLGLTRSSQLYSKDISSGIGDYLPFFSTRRKADVAPGLEKKDLHSSLFFRWVWPEENAELYGELGIENTLRSSRQAALEPDRSRAYVVGLRKMVNLPGAKQQKLLVDVEVTQLQQTKQEDVLGLKSWYVNRVVRHGYTHRGEVLGAGAGPGGNSQTVEISWLDGQKRIGLQFERYLHNNDWYYYSYTAEKDFRRHWTDLSIGISGEWNWRNFIFNGMVKGSNTLNYQWYIPAFNPLDPKAYFQKSKKIINFQLQAGVQYVF